MKNLSRKTIFFIFCLSLVLGNFLIIPPALAGWELMKSNTAGTIYYIDSRGSRHPFPNDATYQSWYGNDYSKILTVTNDVLLNYPLGKNITVRPGTKLVKVNTMPQVYAVEQGGVLRHLENESIAEAIYGEDWNKKIVDIPDVFFGNYTLGEPIVHDYTVPDGILFQDQDTGIFHYKNNSILTPFESVEAVLANRLDPKNAIAGFRQYFVRSRPITGLDKSVFNPNAEPIIDASDCESKNLRAAIIFLADQEYNNVELDNLQKIKAEISGRFSWVTNGMSEIDISYPTTILLDDGYLIEKRNDNTTDVKAEAVNTFYGNNPDIFDFLIIWTNFKIPSENTNEVANFVSTDSRLEGINKYFANRAEFYGSKGKLKGIITMGNINKYDPKITKGMNEALNILMHEILHNWAANIVFTNEDGESSQVLLRSPDYSHWSYYAGFVSPLGGSGWTDNGDGTFTNALSKMADTNLRKYSQLDLYLMGLIPSQLMDPIMYLEPETPGAVGNVIRGKAKYITIDQIIDACGEIKCKL